MARITPPIGNGAFVELDDHELYEGQLVNIDWGTSSEQYGGDTRMILDWQIGEDANDTVRDYLSLRLGKQQSGQVSKLRMLLNSLSHRKDVEEIAWFDDESLEWSYDGVNAENKLELGMTVGFRGRNVAKQDGSGDRFAINVYQPMKQKSASAGRSKPKPAAARQADVDPDDVPF